MLDFIFRETHSVQSTTILPHESGETIAVNQECSFSRFVPDQASTCGLRSLSAREWPVRVC